jgi:hypothetical protein
MVQVLTAESQAYLVDPESTIARLLEQRVNSLLPFPPTQALVILLTLYSIQTKCSETMDTN